MKINLSELWETIKQKISDNEIISQLDDILMEYEDMSTELEKYKEKINNIKEIVSEDK